MEKKELVVGKRYQWPDSTPCGRMINGLFTGKYKENGDAILQCRNGDIWSVSPQNCEPMPRKEK